MKDESILDEGRAYWTKDDSALDDGRRALDDGRKALNEDEPWRLFYTGREVILHGR